MPQPIRVSKKIAKNLENLLEKIKTQNLDETIQLHIKKQHKAALEKSFGIAKKLFKIIYRGGSR